MNESMKRWEAANTATSFTERWEQFNRHMWRCKAMYFGGDVEFGQFPGSLAGQRLHNYRQPPPTESQEFESVCDDSFTGLGRLRRRFEALDKLRVA